MATMTDIIEKFIKDLMKDSNSIQIQRNELASLFCCVPSQINYVLTTRFTLDRGYFVESKQGGGGYVQIAKIQANNKDYITNLLNEKIGNQISFKRAKDIVENLKDTELITGRESKIILSSIDDKSLVIPLSDLKEKVRANILKNLIILLINTGE